MLGVELRTVGKWLQKDGVQARPRGAAVGQGVGARKNPIAKEDLERMYLSEGMTQRQIADLHGLSEWAVGKRLRAFGIESRPTNWVRDAPRKDQFTPEDLRRLYVTERKTMKEIAEMYSVNPVTVSKWLRRYSIPVEQAWERRAVQLDANELKRLYVDEGWTLNRIAKHFSCSTWTVRWNFRRNEIPVRGICERRRMAVFSRAERAAHRGYPMETRLDEDGVLETVTAHRASAEQAMGRALKTSEIVHHINGIKGDDSHGNLAVLPSPRTHSLVHKYMERVGMYLAGLSTIRPEPLDFGAPVFWGGRFVTSVDLIPPGARAFGQPSLGATTSPAIAKEVVN